MLSKEQIMDVKNCKKHSCKDCSIIGNGCNFIVVAQTALHLLNRVETAETILRDVLASGNVAACRKEIEAWLNKVGD